LGFAFGLTPDGRHGKSNEDIADVIQGLNVDCRRVYVQWEIADALTARGISISSNNVAWPPAFTVNDITNPRQLAMTLYFSTDPVITRVYQALPATVQTAIADWARTPQSAEATAWLADVLTLGLNSLLRDAGFYLAMPNGLQLPQLRRDLSIPDYS
jgi:hypothetical protein